MGKASMSLLVATMLGILVLCGPAWAVEPNLVSHWKLDEGSGITELDCIGDNNGIVHGAVWTTGQVDGALSFDGSDDYVDMGSAASLELGSFTISAWIKPSDLSSVQQIAGKLGNEPVHNRGYGYSLEIRDGKVSLLIDPAGCCNGNPIKSETSLEVGKWYFVAGTYDGSTGTIYVDGQPENSDLWTLGAYYTNFYIGARRSDYHSAFYDHFSGVIDEVRVYDRALSAEEIEELYWEGLSPLVLATMQIEEAIAEKEDALDGIDAALEKELVAYGALEELLESGDYGELKKGDIVKAEQKVHSAMQRQERSADALEGSIGKLEDALSALGWEPNLVSHWKFDEGSGAIAYDSVGGNIGTVHGTIWTAGQIDGALDFDGVNDYVDCGTGPAITGTGNFTTSAWIKVRELPAGGLLPVVNQRSTSSANGSYIIDVRSSGYVHFEVYNGGYGFYFDSDVNVGDGFWHHIVGVRTSTTEGEIYVDGNLAGSGSGLSKSLNNVDVVIGRWNGSAFRYFNGIIDDVRIYNRALSAEEVQQLYQDGL